MRIQSFKIIFILALIIFIACSKNDDNYDITIIEFPEDFEQEFVPTQQLCTQTLNEIIINLSNNDNIQIIFSLSGLDEGTYQINPDYSFYGVASNSTPNKFVATAVLDVNERKYYAKSGKINISSVTDENINGTYEVFGYSRDSYQIKIYIKDGILMDIPVRKIQYDQVKDYESHSYKTVKIGEQTWMAENLMSTIYPDGSPVIDFYTFKDHVSEYSNSDNVFYTWAAANQSNTINQDICPSGWHVPSIDEWQQLIDYSDQLNLRGDKKLKTNSGWDYIYWDAPPRVNFNTNSSGFTIQPTGKVRGEDLYFDAKKSSARFWTNKVEIADTDTLYYLRIFDQHGEYDIWPKTNNAKEGVCVRCIKDK